MYIRNYFLLLLTILSLNCEKQNILHNETKRVSPPIKSLTEDGGLKYDLAWSPDGSQIAFTEQFTFNRFYEYRINSYSSYYGYEVIDEIKNFPRLSPDKTKILYLRKNDNLCIASLETGNILYEFKIDYYISNPVWSAEGSQVAYQYNLKNDEMGIEICDTTGNQIERVNLDKFIDLYTFTWSPDGSHFIGSCKTVEYGWDLWKIPMDGSDFERWTTSSSSEEIFPEYSHDGKYIAFIDIYYSRKSLRYLNTITKYVYNFISDITDLESFPVGDPVLSWSDDDSKILYSTFDLYSSEEGQSSKWIYNISDSSIDSLRTLNPFQHLIGWSNTNNALIMFTKYNYSKAISKITIADSQFIRMTDRKENQYYYSNPTWNKSGDRITFLRNNYVYNINVTNSKMEQFGEFRSSSKINYSPDGKQFVYSNNGNIFIGKNQANPEIKCMATSFSYLYEPVWAPDGNRIACRTYYPDALSIFKVSQDSLVLIKTIPDLCYDIAWSSEIPNWGSLILYRSYYENNLFAINPENEQKIQLLEGENIHSACWSPDGLSIAYAIDTYIYIKNIFYDLTDLSD